MIDLTNAKFRPGMIVVTPAALAALNAAGQSTWELIARHIKGDWGVVCKEDAELNDQAVIDGTRILSAYILPNTDEKVWIITEAADDTGNRSATTLLLPDEY